MAAHPRTPVPPSACARPGCAHPRDYHRLDDALNLSPVDPAAPFRCLGYDCTRDGTYTAARRATGRPQPPFCDCPDYLPALAARPYQPAGSAAGLLYGPGPHDPNAHLRISGIGAGA